MSNYWKHGYFEKNVNELHANIFRSLETEHYLKKVLKNQNFNLYKSKINFSDSVLNVFLSIYNKNQQTTFITKNNTLVTEIAAQKSDRIKQKNRLSTKKQLTRLNKKIKKYSKQKQFLANLLVNLKHIKIRNFYKNCLLKLENKNLKSKISATFAEKILNSLAVFTKNKLDINLTIQEVNFINLNSNAKQVLLNFRRFEKTPFFKKCGSLLIPLVGQSNSAKLLLTFIETQLKTNKQHNFFFNFLKESLALAINQKFSKIRGLKIVIKGRLNNAARSRHRVISLGKIPLITNDSKIDYAESTAFTSNGTIGISIWVCEKSAK